MTKVQGAKVAVGTNHLHTISDVALANNQNDTVTTGRPVLYIINGERVEYTQAQVEAEIVRRATFVEHYAAGERQDSGELLARLMSLFGCTFIEACDALESMEDGNVIVHPNGTQYRVVTGGHHEEAQNTWTLHAEPYSA